MIRSMTGYARVELQYPFGRVSCELRSVNHRYLDLSIKLPDELRVIENELRQLAVSKIGRGKVEIGLRLNRDTATQHGIELDAPRLAALVSALTEVAATAPMATSPSTLQLLAWPGVIRTSGEDGTAVAAAAVEAAAGAMTQFTESREREGGRLLAYILERLEQLNALVEAVIARAPVAREAWLERLRLRCQELAVELEPARLAQELALVAQRLDVDEELSRLRSHFQEVRAALRRSDSVGRRLDFLMQELNREANTLSSKSQDAETTRCAVEMKVLIEQVREQVQNIE